MLVLALLITSFCNQYWQLVLVQGVMTGIAMGLVFGSGVIILMSYFSRRMGIATGIAAAGASTGESDGLIHFEGTSNLTDNI